jgi:hypothetical protein
MAAGTVTSRATGLIRDMALVAAIGFGTLADTYSLGNSLPNIIYILVAGGALNAVFIPQLVRHMENDEDGGHGFANRLLRVVSLTTLRADRPGGPRRALDRGPVRHQRVLRAGVRPRRRVRPVVPAPDRLLRALHDVQPGAQCPRPLRLPDVRADRQQRRGDRWAIAFIWVAGDQVDVTTITDAQVAWLGDDHFGRRAAGAGLIPVLLRSGFRFGYVPGLRGFGLGHTGGSPCGPSGWSW